jgi:hypothetical protein
MSGIGASRRPWDIRVRDIFGLQLPLSCLIYVLIYVLQIREKALVLCAKCRHRSASRKSWSRRQKNWGAVLQVASRIRPSAVRIQEQPSATRCVTCPTCPGARRTSETGLGRALSALNSNESETLRSRRSRDTGLPLRHDRNLRPGTTAEKFSICLSVHRENRRTAHPDHCGTIGAPQSL